MMRQLSLKVLLSLFVLMFSASVGLSAVFKCEFSAKGNTQGPHYGVFLLDTEKGNVTVSQNSWTAGKINGSHKVKITDNGTQFRWLYSTWGSNYWVKLNIKSPNTSSEAKLSVVRNAMNTRYKNTGPCKIVTFAKDTAKNKLPIYECKYLGQDRYTRDLVYKIDIKQKTLTIFRNSIVDETHKITLSNKGNVISWLDIKNHSTNTIFKIVLKDPNVSTEARYEVFTFGQGYTLQMNCKLLQPDVVAAVATPSETEASKPNTLDALEAVFLTQQAFDRRNIQLILSDLSFYKSTIDGLYGSGTESALYAYNDEYFRGSDLTKEDNVTALFEDILSQRVVEVNEPPSLDNLIEQIDEIVGGELEPGEVGVSN